MRFRTLTGGVGLGVLMLAALTLAGSFSALSTTGPPVPDAGLSKPVEPGMLSASQPPLEQAALRITDLPGGAYAYTVVLAALPKATGRRLPKPERCWLMLDPGTFARGDAVSATLREIQRVTQNCKVFRAVLDDGTPVRVLVKESRRVANGVLTLRRAGHVLSDPRARLGACLGCGWL